MKLEKEQRTIVFRKETFEVMYHYWKDEDSGDQFTSTALDEINLEQAHHQYRSRHQLPFPDDIREIRVKYGLSASKMSEILGFGTNVYRQYETGEVPSESNGRLIQLAGDPQQFRSLVSFCSSLEAPAKTKLLHRIDQLLQEQREKSLQGSIAEYLLGPSFPDEFTGYRRPDLRKFSAMVSLFSAALRPWKTKLNKLLFYADFIHFSKTCHSISGVRYDAIQMGPVPHNFQSIYPLLAQQNLVAIQYTSYDNGSIGERFSPVEAAEEMTKEVLSADELETIEEVIQRFKRTTNQEIIFESHLEKAWKDNVDQAQPSISYLKYAFEIVRPGVARG